MLTRDRLFDILKTRMNDHTASSVATDILEAMAQPEPDDFERMGAKLRAGWEWRPSDRDTPDASFDVLVYEGIQLGFAQENKYEPDLWSGWVGELETPNHNYRVGIGSRDMIRKGVEIRVIWLFSQALLA